MSEKRRLPVLGNTEQEVREPRTALRDLQWTALTTTLHLAAWIPLAAIAAKIGEAARGPFADLAPQLVALLFAGAVGGWVHGRHRTDDASRARRSALAGAAGALTGTIPAALLGGAALRSETLVPSIVVAVWLVPSVLLAASSSAGAAWGHARTKGGT